MIYKEQDLRQTYLTVIGRMLVSFIFTEFQYIFHCSRFSHDKYVVHCTIWYHLCNLKNLKNIHGGVLLLVKLQAWNQIGIKSCNASNMNLSNRHVFRTLPNTSDGTFFATISNCIQHKLSIWKKLHHRCFMGSYVGFWKTYLDYSYSCEVCVNLIHSQHQVNMMGKV